MHCDASGVCRPERDHASRVDRIGPHSGLRRRRHRPEKERRFMTVMIVDDNPHVREIVRESFSRTDTIVECSDGTEAVLRYGDIRPDWVVMDVVMEPMNGFIALDLILKADPRARVIMMTQFKDPRFRDKALNGGALELLSKEELGRIDEMIDAFGREMG